MDKIYENEHGIKRSGLALVSHRLVEIHYDVQHVGSVISTWNPQLKDHNPESSTAGTSLSKSRHSICSITVSDRRALDRHAHS